MALIIGKMANKILETMEGFGEQFGYQMMYDLAQQENVINRKQILWFLETKGFIPRL